MLWDTLSTVDKDPTERDRDSGAANPDPLRAKAGAGAEAAALGRTESRWVIEKSKAELSTVDSSRDSVDSGIYGVGE